MTGRTCERRYWLLCDKKVRLVSMVHDIIEELLDLDSEPKAESLWWTSTHQAEEEETMNVENRGLTLDLVFKDVFEVLGYRFHRDVRESQGAGRTSCNGMASRWRDACIYRTKIAPMKKKCRRVLSHVCVTALDGSVIWRRAYSRTVHSSHLISSLYQRERYSAQN